MYRVEIAHQGDSVFRVTSKDYAFLIDTQGKGITPPDTLLASLGSCIGVYIRKYAEGARLTLQGFSVSVEADFAKEPPACFREIKVTIDLKGAALDERRQKALLEFIKNCPVHNTLKNNPHVEIALA